MAERLEYGPLEVLDPAAAPDRVELLQPGVFARIQWVAGALLSLVLVWSVALAAGWIDLAGWRVVTRGLPQGSEHLLWVAPGLFAAACLAMAVAGVRVVLGPERLAVQGLWPEPVARTFDLRDLRAAAFRLGTSGDGERRFLAEFAFPGTEVALVLRDRRVWEALRARFANKELR